MAPNSYTMTLKLLVDRKKGRVIFAEAGKEFVDLLFHSFTLPLGSVTKLLSDEFMVGSLGKLYASVQTLSKIYMQPKLEKKDLLDPKTQVVAIASESSLSFLPTRPSSSPEATMKSLYCCKSSYPCTIYYSQNPETVCPSCNEKLSNKSRFALVLEPKNEVEKRIGYVKEEVTFMVKDDLEVTPMSGISSVMLLNEFSLKDLGDLEQRIVYVSTPEVLMILKASLHSKTVLTDVFLLKKPQVPNDVDDEEDEDYDYWDEVEDEEGEGEDEGEDEVEDEEGEDDEGAYDDDDEEEDEDDYNDDD